MATAGIVAEYNPFHRGHAWHIARTRRTLGADTAVICVMSGHWVQRGECALTDKWSRAALALSGGADLVLELPTPWAMASAESFARGAVGLLAATGVVDVLSFGSETGELAPLRAAAAALDGPDYPERLRAGLARGLSFPAARQAAVGAYCLASPNDNLGVEYLRALPPGMEALTIPRRGAHDGPAAGGFASASELRPSSGPDGRRRRTPISPPPERGGGVHGAHRPGGAGPSAHDGRGGLGRPPRRRAAEGLPARLARSARTADSLEDFYARAKTKRYPHARLRRLALAAFLGLRAAERPPAAPYVRVLGLSGRGRELLRRMKETCALPVVVKPAQARALDGDARALFEAEARRTDLFGLCFPTARPCGLEWTRSPVVKERQG
ncbi:MAG: nucleotidyltransferase family protein [Flavonifractor plautii]